jgi:hypothetical protein
VTAPVSLGSKGISESSLRLVSAKLQDRSPLYVASSGNSDSKRVGLS